MFRVADLRLAESEEVVEREFIALLNGVWTPEASRRVLAEPRVEEELWVHLSTWTAIGEAPLVQVCRVLESAGEHLLPGAFTATVGILAPLLKVVDSELFGALVDGRLRGSGTVEVGSCGSGGIGGGMVLAAQRSEVIAIVRDSTVLLARPQLIEEVKTVDLTRSFGRISSGELKAEGDVRDFPPSARERWMAQCAVAIAADMVGSARWLCARAISYAKDREQFGRPIGAFQAVQHRLVDMVIRTQRAAAAVDYAAASIDADAPDAKYAAHVAKATSGEAVIACARDALQIHGAVGFTWENDVHLHLRRGYMSEALFGDRSWHQQRLAASIAEGHLLP